MQIRARRRFLAWGLLGFVALSFGISSAQFEQAVIADTTDPSGSYLLSSRTLGSRTVTLSCTSATCTIEGLGSAISATRNTSTDWLPKEGWSTPGAPIAVARVALTGREYSVNDPQYPQLTRYWIAETVNGAAFDLKSEFRGVAISDAVSGSSSQPGVLLLWGGTQGGQQFIALYVFGQGIPDLQKDCLSNSNGCWSISIGGGSRSQPGPNSTTTSTSSSTTTSTSTSTTTSTTVAVTTTSDVTTTVAETTGAEETTTTAVGAETDSTQPAETAATDSPEDDGSSESFDSPALAQPSTPANSVATAALAVSSVTAVVAAGVAATGAVGAVTGSALGGGSSPSPIGSRGPTGGLAGATGSEAEASRGETRQRQTEQSERSEKVTGGTEQSLFTTEQLERAKLKESNFLLPYPPDATTPTEEWRIWAPAWLTSSRIICRAYVDMLLFSSTCQVIQRNTVRADRAQPGIQPLVVVSLLMAAGIGCAMGLSIPEASGASSTLFSVAVSASAWSGLAASTGVFFGMLSAIHGFFFAAAFLTSAATSSAFRTEELFLAIVVTVVLSMFVPMLSNSFNQPRSLERIENRDWWNLAAGCLVIGLVTLKASQEFAQQVGRVATTGGLGATYLRWHLAIPTIFGALTPVVRFLTERYFRQRDEDFSIRRFLVASADLRSGELPLKGSWLRQVGGILLCSAFIAFIVHTYTEEPRLVIWVVLCFGGVVVANTTRATWLIMRVTRSFGQRLPGMNAWLKLGLPTVLAFVLSICLAIWAPTNQTAALWMTAAFAGFNLLVELYDIATDRPGSALHDGDTRLG